jgi:predicted ester cyclase
MRGTHEGSFLGVPATGRTVSSTGITIFRVESGMLSEGWINFDALGLLRQLGVVAPRSA